VELSQSGMTRHSKLQKSNETHGMSESEADRKGGKMNKREWRKRARTEKADRKRLQEDIRVLRRSAVVQHWQSKKLLGQVNALSEREAVALNKCEDLRLAADRWSKSYDTERQSCEELRRDNVNLATELARVQGVCEATQAQALKHAATIADLREEENAERRRLEEVLTWQRRARETLPRDVRAYTERSLTDSRDETRWVSVFRDDWDKLCQAILSEPVEPKEETP